MKNGHFFALASAFVTAVLLASCSPSAYVMMLESRQPSDSGLDLAGKTMSLIYLESEDGRDTLFNNLVADALALALENEFFDGEEAVHVYNLVKDRSGDYASRDTASQYVMLLDSDVVMILDTPEYSGVAAGRTKPLGSKLYVYDSMSEGDEVMTFDSNAYVTSLEDASRAMNVGNAFAQPMKNNWKNESFTVLYFDSNSSWVDAVLLADDMKWDEAMEIWMSLSRTRNATKSSCAKYNMALGCYMLGQYELALEWLDASDAARPLSLSSGMRKRIQANL